MKVFISYRREESGFHAARLNDAIAARLGGSNVHTETPDLEHGVDFYDRIRQAVQACNVLLVVIGPDWARSSDEEGRIRLANPEDPVRLELETALHDPEIAVVPVLVDGARMPDADDLPDGVRSLARRHALELSDVHWHNDVERLINGLDDLASAARPAVGATVRGAQVRGPGTDSLLGQLLSEAAREGVLPEKAMAVTAARPHDYAASEPMPTVASPRTAPSPAPIEPPSYGPPRDMRRVRSVLIGAVLVLAPLAALAAALKWLVGCTLDNPVTGEDEPDGEPVDCTVFAPSAAASGEAILVQVFAHLPLQAEDAKALATEFDPGASRRAFKSLESRIARGTTLTLHLGLPGADVDDPVQSLVWRGRAEAVQFGVTVGTESSRSSLIGTVTVRQASVPIGHIKFMLEVRPDSLSRDQRLQPVGDDARRYRTAFTSYASQDRDHVLRGVQMLRAVGIRCFQDVVDLEPGDRWERKLYANFDQSDLFLLFWSSAAKDSRWVRKEVEYALGSKSNEFDPPEIQPIILERPPSPPWPEVAHLHFDDRLVYFIQSEG